MTQFITDWLQKMLGTEINPTDPLMLSSSLCQAITTLDPDPLPKITSSPKKNIKEFLQSCQSLGVKRETLPPVKALLDTTDPRPLTLLLRELNSLVTLPSREWEMEIDCEKLTEQTSVNIHGLSSEAARIYSIGRKDFEVELLLGTGAKKAIFGTIELTHKNCKIIPRDENIDFNSSLGNNSNNNNNNNINNTTNSKQFHNLNFPMEILITQIITFSHPKKKKLIKICSTNQNIEDLNSIIIKFDNIYLMLLFWKSIQMFKRYQLNYLGIIPIHGDILGIETELNTLSRKILNQKKEEENENKLQANFNIELLPFNQIIKQTGNNNNTNVLNFKKSSHKGILSIHSQYISILLLIKSKNNLFKEFIFPLNVNNSSSSSNSNSNNSSSNNINNSMYNINENNCINNNNHYLIFSSSIKFKNIIELLIETDLRSQKLFFACNSNLHAQLINKCINSLVKRWTIQKNHNSIKQRLNISFTTTINKNLKNELQLLSKFNNLNSDEVINTIENQKGNTPFNNEENGKEQNSMHINNYDDDDLNNFDEIEYNDDEEFDGEEFDNEEFGDEETLQENARKEYIRKGLVISRHLKCTSFGRYGQATLLQKNLLLPGWYINPLLIIKNEKKHKLRCKKTILEYLRLDSAEFPVGLVETDLKELINYNGKECILKIHGSKFSILLKNKKKNITKKDFETKEEEYNNDYKNNKDTEILFTKEFDNSITIIIHPNFTTLFMINLLSFGKILLCCKDSLIRDLICNSFVIFLNRSVHSNLQKEYDNLFLFYSSNKAKKSNNKFNKLSLSKQVKSLRDELLNNNDINCNSKYNFNLKLKKDDEYLNNNNNNNNEDDDDDNILNEDDDDELPPLYEKINSDLIGYIGIDELEKTKYQVIILNSFGNINQLSQNNNQAAISLYRDHFIINSGALNIKRYYNKFTKLFYSSKNNKRLAKLKLDEYYSLLIIFQSYENLIGFSLDLESKKNQLLKQNFSLKQENKLKFKKFPCLVRSLIGLIPGTIYLNSDHFLIVTNNDDFSSEYSGNMKVIRSKSNPYLAKIILPLHFIIRLSFTEINQANDFIIYFNNICQKIKNEINANENLLSKKKEEEEERRKLKKLQNANLNKIKPFETNFLDPEILATVFIEEKPLGERGIIIENDKLKLISYSKSKHPEFSLKNSFIFFNQNFDQILKLFTQNGRILYFIFDNSSEAYICNQLFNEINQGKLLSLRNNNSNNNDDDDNNDYNNDNEEEENDNDEINFKLDFNIKIIKKKKILHKGKIYIDQNKLVVNQINNKNNNSKIIIQDSLEKIEIHIHPTNELIIRIVYGNEKKMAESLQFENKENRDTLVSIFNNFLKVDYFPKNILKHLKKKSIIIENKDNEKENLKKQKAREKEQRLLKKQKEKEQREKEILLQKQREKEQKEKLLKEKLLKEQREKEEKEKLLKKQREKEQREKEEKEKLLKEQREKERLLKKQREKKQREKEQREKEQREKEQREKEQREKEQREKEQRTKEKLLKEQREKEQKEKLLKKQREKEQREKEQREKEQREKERKEKEQEELRKKEKLLKEQREKEQKEKLLKEQKEKEQSLKEQNENENENEYNQYLQLIDSINFFKIKFKMKNENKSKLAILGIEDEKLLFSNINKTQKINITNIKIANRRGTNKQNQIILSILDQKIKYSIIFNHISSKTKFIKSWLKLKKKSQLTPRSSPISQKNKQNKILDKTKLKVDNNQIEENNHNTNLGTNGDKKEKETETKTETETEEGNEIEANEYANLEKHTFEIFFLSKQQKSIGEGSFSFIGKNIIEIIDQDKIKYNFIFSENDQLHMGKTKHIIKIIFGEKSFLFHFKLKREKKIFIEQFRRFRNFASQNNNKQQNQKKPEKNENNDNDNENENDYYQKKKLGLEIFNVNITDRNQTKKGKGKILIKKNSMEIEIQTEEKEAIIEPINEKIKLALHPKNKKSLKISFLEKESLYILFNKPETRVIFNELVSTLIENIIPIYNIIFKNQKTQEKQKAQIHFDHEFIKIKDNKNVKLIYNFEIKTIQVKKHPKNLKLIKIQSNNTKLSILMKKEKDLLSFIKHFNKQKNQSKSSNNNNNNNNNDIKQKQKKENKNNTKKSGIEQGNKNVGIIEDEDESEGFLATIQQTTINELELKEKIKIILKTNQISILKLDQKESSLTWNSNEYSKIQASKSKKYRIKVVFEKKVSCVIDLDNPEKSDIFLNTYKKKLVKN
ncbi:neural cell adhesion molecule [Anaeramoeba flamelloides]|uniref:Neural cell adhesion molecule n=1 Tax=Anaeramoeba flamelloides TaxID=1746091 RepID=A0AAV8AHP5_9EUKA|nr:neural cell adhesion molecule [Anaeramoeba flamelloides]